VWARLAASAFTNRAVRKAPRAPSYRPVFCKARLKETPLPTRQLAFGRLAFLKRLARFARLVRGADGAHT